MPALDSIVHLVSEYGISGGGREAEHLFQRLTGATPAVSASKGDAVLDGHLVEVKQASSNTLNQVRAVKFLPLVVYHRPSGSWYVIPAHEVVRRVAEKQRGQHTEIAFECATLSLATLTEFRLSDPDELRERTVAAAEESAQFVALKAEMKRVLEEAQQLALDSRSRVRGVLARRD